MHDSGVARAYLNAQSANVSDLDAALFFNPDEIYAAHFLAKSKMLEKALPSNAVVCLTAQIDAFRTPKIDGTPSAKTQ